MPNYIALYAYLSIFYLSIYLSIHPSIHLSLSLYIHIYIYIYNYTLICMIWPLYSIVVWILAMVWWHIWIHLADFSRFLQENWHNKMLKIPTLSLSLFFATAFFLQLKDHPRMKGQLSLQSDRTSDWIHSSKMLKGSLLGICRRHYLEVLEVLDSKRSRTSHQLNSWDFRSVFSHGKNHDGNELTDLSPAK